MKKVLSLILCMCMLITLFNANVITANAATGSDMVSFAQSVSGVYYTTGQSRLGPNTFDCSGFVYYVCSNVGISMSSGNTETQRTYGTDVDHSALKSSNNYSNLKAGDLIFMDWGGDGVSDHVGIYIGNGKMIHCWSSPGTPIATSNLSDWGTSTGKIYSYVCDIRRVASDAHTHSYTAGTHYEAVHPHREYSVCSCGDYQYTGNTVYVESCATCNPPVTVSKWVNCERVLWLPANVDIDLYNSPTDIISTVTFCDLTEDDVWYESCEKYAILSNGKMRYPITMANGDIRYIDSESTAIIDIDIKHTYSTTDYNVCECGEGNELNENTYWDLEDGVLTISGTGDMPNYSSSTDVPWYDVRDEIEKVDIESGVTNVGDRAFCGCENLEWVHMAYVENIGEFAFADCENLKLISINGEVKSIAVNAFLDTSITKIQIWCYDVSKWANNMGLAPISNSAHYFHYGFDANGAEMPIYRVIDKSITINGKSVENIGKYAYNGCKYFEKLILTNGVKSVGYRAFAYCENLVSVTIPNSITEIKTSAFDDCNSLTDVYYDGTEEEWNNIKIGMCNSCLTNATIHFAETNVSAVSLDKTSLSLTVGETETLTVTVAPSSATNKNVTWTSSNTSVATVSNGVVTAKAAGTANIVATTEDGEYRASCAVTVSEAIDEKLPAVTIGSVTGKGGQTVNVALDLKNNPGVAGMILKLSYDSNLKLTNVTSGSALSGLTFTAPGDLSANPVNLLWAGMDADFANGTIAVLTFEIPDGLEEGTYEIKASYSAGDIYDDNLEDIDVNIVNGAVNVKNVMLGDASGDGIINAKDITVLSRYIAGGYNVTVVEAAANVNGDSAINAKDITILSRYIAGGYGVELN